jgi:hypothetical protein
MAPRRHEIFDNLLCSKQTLVNFACTKALEIFVEPGLGPWFDDLEAAWHGIR